MNHDDFKFEPVRGLPEALPEGEHILWQGRPSARRLAWEALSLPWVMGYFALLAIWRVGVSSTRLPMAEALLHAVPFLVIGAVCCIVLCALAFVQSRATVYTLTNKRVAMRIGAALTMTLNLPYTQIGSASLSARSSGHGTVAFEILGDTRLSYAMTWPHIRPWHMARTQPALRCIPDAAEVAEIFAEAAEIRTNMPQIARGPELAIAAE